VEPFSLSVHNAAAYLAGKGVVQNAGELNVRELGGGVSNLVLRIDFNRERHSGWVIKQSLGKLRVRDDWRSDRSRVFREAEAIRLLRPVLGAQAVPELILLDRENFLYVMTAAPEGARVWKDDLLAGQVDLETATMVGNLLATLIRATSADRSLCEPFADRTVFDQLRLDPYYRTTAARHPALRGEFSSLIADCLQVQSALVHGDFSPKNILLHAGGVLLIDFEVVHWGDPAFDAGFLINHLMLKALYRPQYASRYLDAVRAFWKPVQPAPGASDPGFERRTVRHLGALMLARIDGKSPVEYLQDEATRDQARALARQLLRERPARLETALEWASAVMPA
jgi:5-methylthioribose kinase